MASQIDSTKIFARIDRSSPDSLLNSLIEELVVLHRANEALDARIVAAESEQSICAQDLESPDAPTELSRSVYVDAAVSLRTEDGFYAVEYDAKGTPYRWTGPEPTFYFELQIDRSLPCALTMRFLQVFMRASREGIVRCFVDGQGIDAKTRAIDGEFELRATLPPRKVPGGTVVSFVCPEVKSPRDVNKSQDPRPLGLAFRWLEVKSLPSATHRMNGKGMPDLIRATRESGEPRGNGHDTDGLHSPEQGEGGAASTSL